MAHYIRVPKDLNDIKEKFILNLTKRQVICFGIGFIIGLPVFYVTKKYMDISNAVALMGISAAPAIICGVFKKNGVFFEKHIKFMYEFLKKPRTRYYRSTNVYKAIENYNEYIKLSRILKKAEGVKNNGAVSKSVRKKTNTKN